MKQQSGSILKKPQIYYLIGFLVLGYLGFSNYYFEFSTEKRAVKANLDLMAKELSRYEFINGHLPDALGAFYEARRMPHNIGENATQVVPSYDGEGGWVYNPDERIIASNSSKYPTLQTKIPFLSHEN